MIVTKEDGVKYFFKNNLINEPFINGYTILEEEDGLKKYINEKGEVAFDQAFYEASPFYNGMAVVSNDKKRTYGAQHFYIINEHGEKISSDYDYILSTEDDLIMVIKYLKTGYLNHELKEIIPLKYTFASRFKEGLAAVTFDKRKMFIDTEGNVSIDCKEYDEIHYFCCGCARVRKDGFYGYINKVGEEITPFVYEKADDFSENLAAVSLNGKNMYINNEGHVVINCDAYDKIHAFYNVLAIVEKNGFCGFIDHNGLEVIPCIYNFISPGQFNKDILTVRHHNTDILVNKKNEELLFIEDTSKENIKVKMPCGTCLDTYEEICQIDEFGFMIVKKHGKYGLINFQGKEVVNPVFDNLTFPNNNGERLGLYQSNYYIIDKFGQVRKAFLDPGIIKISDSLILKLRKEDLYSCVCLLEQMKRADMAEPYYDLIIDGNVVSFKSSEERDEFLNNIILDEDDEIEESMKLVRKYENN